MGQIWAGARRGQEKSLAELCLYWKIPFLRLYCSVLEGRGGGTGELPPREAAAAGTGVFYSPALPAERRAEKSPALSGAFHTGEGHEDLRALTHK